MPNKEIFADMTTESFYDDSTGKMTQVVSQDLTPYLKENLADRNATPEFGKYKRTLTKAASIPMETIVELKNGQCCKNGNTYNLLSPDPDEKRRALLHIQTCHPYLMSINGTPFAKNRVKWQ